MVVEKKNAPTATQNVREENMSNKSISVKFGKIGAKYLSTKLLHLWIVECYFMIAVESTGNFDDITDADFDGDDDVCCIHRKCWNPTWLAGTGYRIINCHRQTNRNRHNWNIWQNTWSTFFIRITSAFSYLCSKKTTNTLHLHSMCGGIKTLKHNVRTTLQLAYHGCKYLTHTSTTRHEKRTQMVVTVRFTIRLFLTFSHWWESNATKLSREKMWSLKTRTVARKSWIRGLNLSKRTWHSENLINSLLIYSVSHLNLEGLSSPMPTVATGLVWISLILSFKCV